MAISVFTAVLFAVDTGGPGAWSARCLAVERLVSACSPPRGVSRAHADGVYSGLWARTPSSPMPFSSPLGHRGAPRQRLSDPFGVVATWRLRHDLADISIHAGSEPTQKLSTWEFGGPDPYLLAARVLHPLRSQPHVLGFARVGMGRADVVKLTSRGAEWADDQRRTELSRIPLSARSHQPRCLALTPGTSTSCSCRSMAGNNTCGEPWMRTATCWTSLSSRDGIDLGAQHANRCLLSIAGAREDILGSADDSTDAD